MRRREFLQAAAGGMVACYSLPLLAKPSIGSFRPGLQLFTVMELLDKDFPGTLSTVAEIGYQEVETMGAFGRDAGEVGAILDRHNLVSPSQHLMPGDLYSYFSAYNRGEITWKAIIDRFTLAFDFDRVEEFVTEAILRAEALGQKYIVWQMNWREGYGLDEVKKHLAAFNLAGELCHDAGLTFAFHNHDLEFAPLDGTTAYDLLVQGTDPEKVKLEMDFMWASKGGVDPVDYLGRYPGRFRLVHLKDRTVDGKVAVPGTGVEDFPRLLKAAERAGVAHAYVELDQPVDPIRDIRQAYAYLNKVSK